MVVDDPEVSRTSADNGSYVNQPGRPGRGSSGAPCSGADGESDYRHAEGIARPVEDCLWVAGPIEGRAAGRRYAGNREWLVGAGA